MLLLTNKRRLEALLRGVLDTQQPDPPSSPLEVGGGGVSTVPASSIQRASSLRSSGSGALSGGLSSLIASNGPGSAGAVLASSSAYGPNLRSQILRVSLWGLLIGAQVL